MRERFEEGNIAIAPLDPRAEQRLMEELANIRWHTDLQGRVVIEAKDDVRATLGRSPDVADSVVICFYDTGVQQTRSSHW